MILQNLLWYIPLWLSTLPMSLLEPNERYESFIPLPSTRAICRNANDGLWAEASTSADTGSYTKYFIPPSPERWASLWCDFEVHGWYFKEDSKNGWPLAATKTLKVHMAYMLGFDWCCYCSFQFQFWLHHPWFKRNSGHQGKVWSYSRGWKNHRPLPVPKLLILLVSTACMCVCGYFTNWFMHIILIKKNMDMIYICFTSFLWGSSASWTSRPRS